MSTPEQNLLDAAIAILPLAEHGLERNLTNEAKMDYWYRLQRLYGAIQIAHDAIFMKEKMKREAKEK